MYSKSELVKVITVVILTNRNCRTERKLPLKSPINSDTWNLKKIIINLQFPTMSQRMGRATGRISESIIDTISFVTNIQANRNTTKFGIGTLQLLLLSLFAPFLPRIASCGSFSFVLGNCSNFNKNSSYILWSRHQTRICQAPTTTTNDTKARSRADQSMAYHVTKRTNCMSPTTAN